MLSDFDNLTTILTCPNCNKETPKELGWLKDNTEFTCDCGNVTVFNNSKKPGNPIKPAAEAVAVAVAVIGPPP